FRMVVAEGENLDTQELPALEMPYGQFRPASGVRDCLNGWLTAGGPHHEVMNLGHHAAVGRGLFPRPAPRGRPEGGALAGPGPPQRAAQAQGARSAPGGRVPPALHYFE